MAALSLKPAAAWDSKMAIQAFTNTFVCDTYAEVLSVPFGVQCFCKANRTWYDSVAGVWQKSLDSNHQVAGSTDYQQILFDQVTVTDATVTPVYTSAVIPENTIVSVNALILCDNPLAVGSAVITLLGTLERQVGASLIESQQESVSTQGSLSLSVATALLTVANNTFTLSVKGKAGYTLDFCGQIEILKGLT